MAVLYKKALAVVAEAEGEGATWVTSLNPIIAAAALAKAKKPMRRAFIGAPTNASYSIAAEMGTPEDATCYEHSRDQTLGYFVRMNKLFMALALVSAICVVGFGGLIVISMFSTLVSVLEASKTICSGGSCTCSLRHHLAVCHLPVAHSPARALCARLRCGGGRPSRSPSAWRSSAYTFGA